jgi:hypothetical protein
MDSQQFSSDNWHREAQTLAIRNNIRLRRWGMRVTVYDDPVGANNGDYVLTYGLTSTNHQDNNNWLLVAAIGATWGGGGGGSLDRVVVATAGGVITLAMDAKQQRQFIGDTDITAPKTWAVTGSDPFDFQFEFVLDGLHAQTMPANFFMNDALWNDATKVWDPLDVGQYLATATFDGTNWVLSINGPII